MKRVMVFLIFVVLVGVQTANAQAHILVGAVGGESFGNVSIGLQIEIDVPVIQHLELDFRDAFSPFESHIALGSGFSNAGGLGPVVWFNKKVGVNGFVDSSIYHVAKASKLDGYWFSGLSLRGDKDSALARIDINYFQEIRSGILYGGTEANDLKGGQVRVEFNIGCSRYACYRTTLEMSAGRVKTQGNPECDGTLGLDTCPRGVTVSGGAVIGFLVEFGNGGKDYGR